MIPLLTTGVPWALLMTWLISSPLNSPNTFFLIAGALGYPMAIAQIVSAVTLGVVSGIITDRLEKKGYLNNQRSASAQQKSEERTGNAHGGGLSGLTMIPSAPTEKKGFWKIFWRSLSKRGTRRLVRQLVLFIFVASAIKILVPTTWIISLFGKEHWYSIFFAALLGIPLYVSNSSSVPIAQTLVEGGMSSGAALAFLLAGAGTSLPAISGLLAITRGRVVVLYVSLVYLGALFFGLIFSVV